MQHNNSSCSSHTSLSAPVSTSPSCNDAIGSPLANQLQSGATSNNNLPATSKSLTATDGSNFASAPHRQAAASAVLSAQQTPSACSAEANENLTRLGLEAADHYDEGLVMGERQKSASELSTSLECSQEIIAGSKCTATKTAQSPLTC